MFDIGFLELLIIGVVALLVLGPERLPKAARTAGLWVGRIKRSVSGMQREISAQLEAEELRQKLKEQQQKIDDSLGKAKRDVESIADDPSTPPAKSASSTQATTSESTTPAPTPTGAATAPEQRLDDALAKARETARDAVTPETATSTSEATPGAASDAPHDHKDSATR